MVHRCNNINYTAGIGRSVHARTPISPVAERDDRCHYILFSIADIKNVLSLKISHLESVVGSQARANDL